MKHVCFAATTLVLLALAAGSARGQRPRGPGGSPDQFNPLLRFFDVDRDNALSLQEMENAAAKLKELDTNKDGRLAPDELRGQMPLGRGGEPRFGRGGPPGGPGDRGLPNRGGGQAAATGAEYENPPLPKDDAEKKILETLAAVREGDVRFANVSANDGRLLRQLAEMVGAKRVVEIGTSTGESGMCFALALRTTGGRLVTHEMDHERAQTARENFKKAGVDHLVTIVEGDAHQTIAQHKEPIDILFLDADKQGYIDYLEKLLPLIRPGGLIIAHNMSPRQADRRYLEAITKNPALETSFLLMEGAGVGVTMKKR